MIKAPLLIQENTEGLDAANRRRAMHSAVVKDELLKISQEISNNEHAIVGLEAQINSQHPPKLSLKNKLTAGVSTAVTTVAASAAAGFWLTPVVAPVLGVVAAPIVVTVGSAIFVTAAALKVYRWVGEKTQRKDDITEFQRLNEVTLNLKIKCFTNFDNSKELILGSSSPLYRTAEEQLNAHRNSVKRAQSQHQKEVKIGKNKKVQADIPRLPQLKVNLLRLSDAQTQLLKQAFVRKSTNTLKSTFSKIAFTHLQLTDTQFIDMLSHGMGEFNTEQLTLSHNLLTDESIKKLKDHILAQNSTAFQKIKKLDLSHNQLTGKCLPHLQDIVRHLKIEELDISNNELCEEPLAGEVFDINADENIHLSQFLNNKDQTLASLKSLHIRNIGINDHYSSAIGKFLKSLSMLESCDLSENPNLNYVGFMPLKEEANGKSQLKLGVSIKALKTDHDKVLDLAALLNDRKADLAAVLVSRGLYLVDALVRKQEAPAFMQKLPSLPNSQVADADKVASLIRLKRYAILNISTNLDVPVTEFELINAFQGTLDTFYKAVLDGKYKEQVDSNLLKKMSKRVVAQPAPAPAQPAQPAPVQATPNHGASTSQTTTHLHPNIPPLVKSARLSHLEYLARQAAQAPAQTPAPAQAQAQPRPVTQAVAPAVVLPIAPAVIQPAAQPAAQAIAPAVAQPVSVPAVVQPIVQKKTRMSAEKQSDLNSQQARTSQQREAKATNKPPITPQLEVSLRRSARLKNPTISSEQKPGQAFKRNGLF